MIAEGAGRGRQPLVLLLLLVVALLCSAQPAAGAHKPPLGFVSSWEHGKELRLSRKIGAAGNHLAVTWANVEPRPPCKDLLGGESVHSYNWAATDRMVGELAGSRPVLMVFAAPAWASDPDWRPSYCGSESEPVTPQPPCSCAYPPAPSHLEDWSAFIEAITERYGGSLAALEVWNEPNFSVFWSPEPDPAAFERLLKASKSAAAEGSPGLPVIVGGLLPSQKNVPGEQIKQQAFLQRLYQRGAAEWFDGVGSHPYPFGEPWVKGMQIRLNQLRRVQRRFGDRAPIWITEIGLPAENGSRRWVSLDEQGPMLWRMYKSTWGQRVRSFTIFSLREERDQGLFTSYGLTRHNYRPKPAWCYLYEKLEKRRYRSRSCRKHR